MSEENSTETSISVEVAALKEKYENIKSQTEEFVTAAKHLSETGVHGAKEIFDSAKSNWHNILASLGEQNLSTLIAKVKKVNKKKVVSKAKKLAKKVVKKVKSAKKTKSKAKKKR